MLFINFIKCMEVTLVSTWQVGGRACASHTHRWVSTRARWDGAGKGCSPWSPPQPTSLLLPAGYSISSFLQMLHPECKELPEPNLLPGQLSHGAVGVKEGRVQWISMAFESVSPWQSGQAQCRGPRARHL